MSKSISGYYLIFAAHFDRDLGIDTGRLCLEHLTKGHQQIWIAWSSHASGQQHEDFHQRGGLIPPAYRVPLLAQWWVDTIPLDLSHVRGVDGNFYKINPHEVKTDKGGTRSDFGIHLDSNAPGSLGCIVTDEERFRSFENVMTRLRQEGVFKLPLNVVYS
jgi:hypothetical protein